MLRLDRAPVHRRRHPAPPGAGGRPGTGGVDRIDVYVSHRIGPEFGASRRHDHRRLSSSAAEDAAEQALALLLLATAGPGQRTGVLLRRLYDHEPLAGEAHRERLSGTPPEQRAETQLL